MLANRALQVSPFLAVEMYGKSLQLAREGKDIIHLEIGEPDFATPKVVGDALANALRDGYTHYSDAIGDFELREQIASSFKRKYGVVIHPDQVLCFPGTSPAMFMLATALIEHDDEVILPNPHYPCYASTVTYAGGRPVLVPTHESDGFRLDPADVAMHRTAKTKAMFINSPCNPTGVLMEASRMQALADLDIMIISDEIYHGLNYSGERDHSILEYTDNAIVMGGFSKLQAMTGWRLGYLIVPRSMTRTMRILMQHFFISASSLVQRAGIAALNDADNDIEAMRLEYDRRRHIMLEGLGRLGFGIKVEPLGAFYILANATHLRGGKDSLGLAFDILDECGVAATPGADFGNQAEGFLRFSYANSQKNLSEALRRLGAYVETHAI